MKSMLDELLKGPTANLVRELRIAADTATALADSLESGMDAEQVTAEIETIWRTAKLRYDCPYLM